MIDSGAICSHHVLNSSHFGFASEGTREGTREGICARRKCARAGYLQIVAAAVFGLLNASTVASISLFGLTAPEGERKKELSSTVLLYDGASPYQCPRVSHAGEVARRSRLL